MFLKSTIREVFEKKMLLVQRQTKLVEILQTLNSEKLQLLNSAVLKVDFNLITFYNNRRENTFLHNKFGVNMFATPQRPWKNRRFYKALNFITARLHTVIQAVSFITSTLTF